MWLIYFGHWIIEKIKNVNIRKIKNYWSNFEINCIINFVVISDKIQSRFQPILGLPDFLRILRYILVVYW